MKLTLGCGNHRIEGFLGVDKLKTAAANVICDLGKFPGPSRDGTAEEATLYHIKMVGQEPLS